MFFIRVALAVCATCASAAAQLARPGGEDQGANKIALADTVAVDDIALTPGRMTSADVPAGSAGPEPSGSAAYAGWVPYYLSGRSQFKTEVYSGFRYDSDANQAADTAAGGSAAQAVTPSAFAKQSDWSILNKVSINHQYAFPRWRDTAWESNTDISDQRFFHISHNFDLTTAQADTGPRFQIGEVSGVKGSVRPFGSIVWIGYGEHSFSTLYGGGLATEVRTSRWGASLVGIGRFGNYEDSAFRPSSRPYTGPEWLLSLSTTFVLDPATSLATAFWWYQGEGRSADFSRQGPAASLSLDRELRIMNRVAEFVTRGSWQRVLYGGPPAQTPLSATRQDTQWIGSLSLSVPIFRSMPVAVLGSARAVVEYQYFRNDSNFVPFVDHSLTIGIKASL